MKNKTEMRNMCGLFAYWTLERIRASISLFLQISYSTPIIKSIRIFNLFTFFNHSNSPINKEPSTRNHANSFRTHCTQSFSHPRCSLTSLHRRRRRRDPPPPPLRGIRSFSFGEPQGYPHCRRWEDRKKVPDRGFPRRHR